VTACFFGTSALVKRYAIETGTASVSALLDPTAQFMNRTNLERDIYELMQERFQSLCLPRSIRTRGWLRRSPRKTIYEYKCNPLPQQSQTCSEGGSLSKKSSKVRAEDASGRLGYCQQRGASASWGAKA
jgi:hypothetical protein